MITRRDGLVAVLAAGLTLGGVALSGRAEVMGSSIFEWEKMTAQTTKTGMVRRVVQQPTATLDELEIHITTLNPGESPHAPHKHPDEELIVIKEGTVESFLNGQTQRVGPGSIIFQASNQMHGIKNVGTGPATYHVIKWNSPGMLNKR
jgi:XRE family transcriptional regulator, regulator of sulfur utilization